RLFLLLAAAAVVGLHATHKLVLDGPNGQKFPDGTLITFWFKHQPNNNHPHDQETEVVAINFWGEEPVNFDLSDPKESKKILAHLRIQKKDMYGAVGSSFIEKATGKWTETHGNMRWNGNGDEWGKEIWTPTPDIGSYSYKWWRVDVYKHGNEYMSVFFQGFWAESRKFPIDKIGRSLNNVQFVSLTSGFVDYDQVEIYVKTPSANLANPTTFNAWMTAKHLMNTHEADDTEDKNIIRLPNFPENGNIEVSVVLKGSQNTDSTKTYTSYLDFVTISGGKTFMRILQRYEKGSYKNNLELWITDDLSMEYDVEPSSNSRSKMCADKTDRPHGDLQHLFLKRVDNDNLELIIFFNQIHPQKDFTPCKYTLTPGQKNALHAPFKLATKKGGLVLHLQSSMKKI
ncbi:hypothetical protein PMAYCL1PPCAC_08983, partial [Pristionchus mayeri]